MAMPRDLPAPPIVIAHGGWADATNYHRRQVAHRQDDGIPSTRLLLLAIRQRTGT